MKGKVLVTGASRGLGEAIVKRLLADGHEVVGAARSSPDPALLGAAGFSFEPFDLSDPTGLHPWVRHLTKRHGRIVGLVNNAAVGAEGVLATMHESDIAASLRVNLESPIVLTKYLSRHMLLNGGGSIVNVTSIVASTGYSGLSVYAATKAGLVGFTRSLSRELGKAGIRVNAVAPGYMQTEMTAGLVGPKLESIKRRSPSGQLTTLEGVASAVSFLIGPDSAMMNGTVVTVDNGSTA